MDKSKKAAITGSALLVLLATSPRSFFQQSLFELFLAFDAVACPGHRFQALGVDLLAAVDALAEAALADAQQRLFHHLQQLPLVVALGEEKFLGVGAGSTIGNVLRGVFVRRATILLGARYRAAQLLLSCFQPFLK